MTINDKHNIISSLASRDKVIIELGCGDRKRRSDAIGVDILDYDSVDLIGDIFDVLGEFPAESVDLVTSHHVFEHLPDMDALIQALARITKPGGELKFVVPHFSNPYYYSDYTHKSYFGLYTFCYVASQTLFSRKVPTYQRELVFELTDVKLGFKSSPPFYIRHAFKRMMGIVFNLSRYMQELYEEMFCYLVPCYEVEYTLRKNQQK